MTTEKLNREEIATLIKAQQISKSKGIPPGANISEICKICGVSRKTGYKYLNVIDKNEKESRLMEKELSKLEEKYTKLEERYDDLRFENEGRKLAWEIHSIDELLAEKKTTSRKRKRKKR
jgi:transposase